MDTTTPLDEAMDRRRIELGLSWDEIAAQAKVSTAFLREYRKGRKGARDLTKALLEDALRWKRGSIDGLSVGNAPAPAANPVPTLGELLVKRGLAKSEDLTFVENVRDPDVVRVLGIDTLDDQTKDEFLKGYMQMRRQVFAGVLNDEGGPQGG